MNWTSQQYYDRQRREAAWARGESGNVPSPQAQSDPTETQVPLIPGIEDEEDIHNLIISWARRQEPPVPYGRARMDRKSTYTKGFADFILIISANCFLLIECKTEDGKLDEDQIKFAAACQARGVMVHIIRDYPAFIELVREVMK